MGLVTEHLEAHRGKGCETKMQTRGGFAYRFMTGKELALQPEDNENSER
jgi:hypothetical protein